MHYKDLHVKHCHSFVHMNTQCSFKNRGKYLSRIQTRCSVGNKNILEYKNKVSCASSSVCIWHAADWWCSLRGAGVQQWPRRGPTVTSCYIFPWCVTALFPHINVIQLGERPPAGHMCPWARCRLRTLTVLPFTFPVIVALSRSLHPCHALSLKGSVVTCPYINAISLI